MGGRIIIKTFDGDVHALYKLMRDSWSEDYRHQIRFDYSTEFLTWNIEAPSSDPELLLGAYDGSQLVGFCARFPRNIFIDGQPTKAALGTFLTTHLHYRRKGIGKSLVASSIQRLKDKGYAGYFYYLQRAHASTPLYRDLAIQQILIVPKIRFYVKFLNPESLRRAWKMTWVENRFFQALKGIPRVKSAAGHIRSYTKEDLYSCLQLLNRFDQSVVVARRWTAEELAWRLEGFPAAFTYLLEDQGQVRGLIHFYLMGLCGNRWGWAEARAGFATEKVAFIDNMRLNGLKRNQQQALLSRALQHMKEAGCTVTVIPSVSCSRIFPLVRSGFLLDMFTPPTDLYFTFTPIRPEVGVLRVKGRLHLDFM